MKTYTVQSGDTLSSIAENLLGNAGLWKSLYDANRDTLSNPNKIQVGQRLKVPGGGSGSSTSTSGGMLRLGSRGQAVTSLQQNLNALEYSLGTDGIFGPATDRAVRDVQGSYGLSPDGVVGPQTQQLITALLAGEEPEHDGDTSTWYSDDAPSNVIAGWQRDLIALGYALAVTGYLDQETLDALHQFQGDNDLDVSDTFDEETRSALYEQSSALEDDEDFDEDEETTYFDESDEDEDEDEEEDEDEDEDSEDEDSEDDEESDDEDSEDDEESDGEESEDDEDE